MAKVIDYIDRWKFDVVGTVALRFGRWPETRSDEWRPIFRALCDANASEDLADRVRDRLADNPPANFADAISAVKAAIQAEQQSGTVVGDREQAHAASMRFGYDPETGLPAPCPDCGANGLTYYRNRDGSPFAVQTAGGLARVVDDLVLTCRCPLGRWMAAQPKCPYGDSQSSRYVDRVVTRREYLAPDSTEEPFVSPAASVRRMVNDSFRAA
jgi:hypothetical protein